MRRSRSVDSARTREPRSRRSVRRFWGGKAPSEQQSFAACPYPPCRPPHIHLPDMDMKLIRDKSGSAELPPASAKTATVQSIEFAEFTHSVPVDAASALGAQSSETRSHPLHGVRTRL